MRSATVSPLQPCTLPTAFSREDGAGPCWSPPPWSRRHAAHRPVLALDRGRPFRRAALLRDTDPARHNDDKPEHPFRTRNRPAPAVEPPMTGEATAGVDPPPAKPERPERTKAKKDKP